MSLRRDLIAICKAILQGSPVVVDVPAEVRRILLRRYLVMARSNGRLALPTFALVVFGFGHQAPLAIRGGLWGTLALLVAWREFRHAKMGQAMDAAVPRSNPLYDLSVLISSLLWGFAPLLIASSVSAIDLYSAMFAAIMAIGLLAISYVSALPLCVTAVVLSIVPFWIWASRQDTVQGLSLMLGGVMAGLALLARVASGHATLLRALASEAENARLVAELEGYRRSLEQENVHLGASLREAHDAASRDALTKLYNRRHLQTLAAPLAEAVTRLGEDITVCVVDIDHFKRVNDRHGHLVGDEVLRAVAGLLGNRLRELDCVARLGGEEFVVVLRRCETTRGRRVAEALRHAVASTEVETEAGAVPVTISVGVAQWSAGETLDGVIGRADRALYVAKTSGRDRVEVDAGDGPRLAGPLPYVETFPAPLA